MTIRIAQLSSDRRLRFGGGGAVVAVLGSGTVLTGLWSPGLSPAQRGLYALVFICCTVAVATGFQRRPRLAKWSLQQQRRWYLFGISGGTLTITAFSALLLHEASQSVAVAAAVLVSALVASASCHISGAAKIFIVLLAMTAIVIGHGDLAEFQEVTSGLMSSTFGFVVALLPIALTVVGWESWGAGDRPRLPRAVAWQIVVVVVTLFSLFHPVVSPGWPWNRPETQTFGHIAVAVLLVSFAGQNIRTMINLARQSNSTAQPRTRISRTRWILLSSSTYGVGALLLALYLPSAVALPLVLPAIATAALYGPVALHRQEARR